MHFNRYYCGKCHLTYLIKKERGGLGFEAELLGACGSTLGFRV